MKIKYRSNLWGGIISLVFGGVLWILVPQQIGTDFSKTYGISSRTLPYAMAVVLIVCGILLILQSLVLKKDKVKELEIKKELMAIAYMAVLLIFAILFKYSFLLSTSLLGIATLALLKCRKKLYYLIVLITVGVLYLLFSQVLHVQLSL